MKTSQKGSLIALLMVLLIVGGVYAYGRMKEADISVRDTIPKVSKAKNDSQSGNANPLQLIDLKTVKVGDVTGNWTVQNIKPFAFYKDRDSTPSAGEISFTGSAVLTGSVDINDMTGQMIFTASRGQEQLPTVPLFSNGSFALRGNTTAITPDLMKNIILEIKNYGVNYDGKEGSGPHAEFVRIVHAEPSPRAVIENPQSQHIKTYTNSLWGYSFEYPDTWNLSVSGDGVTLSPIENKNPEKVTIRVTAGTQRSKQTSLKTLPEWMRQLPNTQCTKAVYGTSSWCMVQGERFEGVRGDDYGASMGTTDYIVNFNVAGGRQTMSYYVPDSELENELNVLKGILSTFSL